VVISSVFEENEKENQLEALRESITTDSDVRGISNDGVALYLIFSELVAEVDAIQSISCTQRPRITSEGMSQWCPHLR
jgi:hypothetical protein